MFRTVLKSAMTVCSAALGVLACSLIASGHSAAQDQFPSSSVTIVVPFGAGGSLDLLARTVAEELSAAWGQQIIVENRSGAGGIIGAEFVVNAAPDGHTLLLTSPSIAANVALQDLPFDPVEDLETVMVVAEARHVLIVPADARWNDLSDLLTEARGTDVKLQYPSTGAGTAGHLSMELFKRIAGIEESVAHIPYREISQAHADLIAGRLDLWTTTMPGALPHIQSGRMRALAVGGSSRSSALPEVPTMQESDVDYTTSSWYGLYAPAETPDAIVEAINDGLQQVLSDGQMVEKLAGMGLEVVASTPEEHGQLLQEEIDTMADLIANIDMSGVQ